MKNLLLVAILLATLSAGAEQAPSFTVAMAPHEHILIDISDEDAERYSSILGVVSVGSKSLTGRACFVWFIEPDREARHDHNTYAELLDDIEAGSVEVVQQHCQTLRLSTFDEEIVPGAMVSVRFDPEPETIVVATIYFMEAEP